MADEKNTENTASKTNGHAAKHDHKKLFHRSFLDTVNLGYLGAAAATLVNAWESVNSYFYKNEKVKPDRHEEALKQHSNELTDIELNFEGKSSWEDWYNKMRSTSAVENKLHTAIDKNVFGDHLLPGPLRTIQRFGELKPYERKSVMVTVATVASIALGAIYSFSRERRMAERLERQEAKNEDLERSANRISR